MIGFALMDGRLRLIGFLEDVVGGKGFVIWPMGFYVAVERGSVK